MGGAPKAGVMIGVFKACVTMGDLKAGVRDRPVSSALAGRTIETPSLGPRAGVTIGVFKAGVTMGDLKAGVTMGVSNAGVG